MKKVVKKIIEAYAKSSTNSCPWFCLHQPKEPKSLIKK